MAMNYAQQAQAGLGDAIKRAKEMDAQIRKYMAENGLDYHNRQDWITAAQALGFMDKNWQPSSEEPGMVHTAQGIFRPEDLPADIKTASYLGTLEAKGASKPFEIQGQWYVIDPSGKQVSFDVTKGKELAIPVETSAPTPKTPEGQPFKPDFTKPNPYAGAPDSYIKEVLKNFQPTPEHPFPPFTGVLVDSEDNIYLDETGRRVQIFTQEQADLFVGGINARAKSKSFQLYDAEIDKEQLKNAGSEKAQQELMQSMLIYGKQSQDEKFFKYQQALNKLDDYKNVTVLGRQQNPVTGKTRNNAGTVTNWDVSGYLWDHPEDTRTLADAGFNQDEVTKISKATELERQAVQDLSRKIKDQEFSSSEMLAFVDAYNQSEAPAYKGSIYKKTVGDAWDKLNDDQKRKLTNIYVADDFKGNVLAEWYGKQDYKNAQAAVEQSRNMTPLDWAAQGALAALLIVPGIGGAAGRVIGGISGAVLTAQTIKDWNKMAGWQKALSIVGDVTIAASIPGAAISGARASGAMTTAGRLKGALKGAASAAFPEGGMENTQIQPSLVIKRGQNVIENVLDPRKIPETVITTSHGTVRLPVSKATTVDQALEFRNRLTELAEKGETPRIEIDGKIVELDQSPFMKANRGGLAHATPQGEAFEEGLVVAVKEGMPESEQGLFMSHEPLPRFTEASAFGKTGEKPIFYIVSPETAKKAIPTGKVYAGTVEMERKFPVGFQLPEPKQKLYTRINGEKVEIWLEKPLSKVAVAKLKAQALVYGIETILKPAIQVKGLKEKGLTKSQVDNLADILKESGQERVALTVSRSYQTIRSTNTQRSVATEKESGTARRSSSERSGDQPTDRASMGTDRETRETSWASERTGAGLREGRKIYDKTRADNERSKSTNENSRMDSITSRSVSENERVSSDNRATNINDRTIRIDDRTPRPENRTYTAETRVTTDRTPPPERNDPSNRNPPPPDRWPRPSERRIEETKEQQGGQKRSLPTSGKDDDESMTEAELRRSVAIRSGFGYNFILTAEDGSTRKRFIPADKVPPGIIEKNEGGPGSAYNSVQVIKNTAGRPMTEVNLGVFKLRVTSPTSIPGQGKAEFIKNEDVEPKHRESKPLKEVPLSPDTKKAIDELKRSVPSAGKSGKEKSSIRQLFQDPKKVGIPRQKKFVPPPRPSGLEISKHGKVYHLKGIGLSRSLPKGTIL
jgi:hypothetical protein